MSVCLINKEKSVAVVNKLRTTSIFCVEKHKKKKNNLKFPP